MPNSRVSRSGIRRSSVPSSFALPLPIVQCSSRATVIPLASSPLMSSLTSSPWGTGFQVAVGGGV
jgi:hypothetical protein